MKGSGLREVCHCGHDIDSHFERRHACTCAKCDCANYRDALKPDKPAVGHGRYISLSREAVEMLQKHLQQRYGLLASGRVHLHDGVIRVELGRARVPRSRHK